MTYQYRPPEENGFKPFKLSRRIHNEILHFGKRSKFTKIDAYYNEKEIQIHYTTNLLGIILTTLFLPLSVVMYGLSSIGEIKDEYFGLWNQKKKGKFLSEHIRATKPDGERSKNFEKLKIVYEKQQK